MKFLKWLHMRWNKDPKVRTGFQRRLELFVEAGNIIRIL